MVNRGGTWSRWLFALIVGAGLLAAAPAPAPASDGLCWNTCEREFAACWNNAGCRRACFNGAPCDSRCSRCIVTGCTGEAVFGCMSTRSACLDGCRDWLPALRAVERMNLEPPIREALLAELKALEVAIDQSSVKIGRAAEQHLKGYRAKLEDLRRKQQIDEAEASALEDIARQVEQSLAAGTVRRNLRTWTETVQDPAPAPAVKIPDEKKN